jgi:hypothetical protein
MIGTTILPDIIRSAILSTRVIAQGVMPVSLFVIAPFEHGKTRLALENKGADNESLVLTDLTGIGLLEQLQMNPLATTVVVNDLSVVVGHRQSVNKLTMSILNALAEEGSYKIAMPKMAHLDLRGRRVNVLACCVPDVVSDKRNWWYRSGLMSRMLQVKFEHSIALQLKIHKAIQDGSEQNIQPNELHVPQIEVPVDFPVTISSELAALSAKVYEAAGETGYRKHKQIRALAAGHAILRTWKHPHVDRSDTEFIEKCLPFLIDGAKI